MVTNNKYCLNLDIECFSDIRKSLEQAQHHHRHSLHKFKQFDISNPFQLNDTNAFLSKFNVSIQHAEIFYLPPQYELSIHIDDKDAGQNHSKINWIFGAAGSRMYWWEPNEGHAAKHYLTDIGTSYQVFDKQNCKEIWSAEVGCPSLVNVGVPHSVHNSTNEGRWCVSLMLGDNDTKFILQWDKAEQLFASLINNKSNGTS